MEEDGGGRRWWDCNGLYFVFVFVSKGEDEGRKRNQNNAELMRDRKRLDTGSSLPKGRAHVSWEWGGIFGAAGCGGELKAVRFSGSFGFSREAWGL